MWEKDVLEFKRETKKDLNKQIRMLRKIIEADDSREVVKISKPRSRSDKSKSKKGSKRKSQRRTRRKVS